VKGGRFHGGFCGTDRFECPDSVSVLNREIESTSRSLASVEEGSEGFNSIGTEKVGTISALFRRFSTSRGFSARKDRKALGRKRRKTSRETHLEDQ
jgi:hypothetical protein